MLDQAALDKSIEVLKTSFNWGTDLNTVKPIEQAIVATHGDAEARQKLETQLVEVLESSASRDAKDYACRQLMQIGTPASLPVLAELLPQKDHSHMARYVLERSPAPEASQVLRDALAKVSPGLKVGVISSLGARRDGASVPAIAALLADSDPAVACAAARALGAIRSTEAAKALAAATPNAEAKSAATDASLACAEGLLAAGDKGQALLIYKKFTGEDQPKFVRLAATRGMLACAGQ